MKSKSKIFTDAEYKALEDRVNGSNDDKTGIYASRVKPKIDEMLNVWIPKRKVLRKLIDGLDKREK